MQIDSYNNPNSVVVVGDGGGGGGHVAQDFGRQVCSCEVF